MKTGKAKLKKSLTLLAFALAVQPVAYAQIFASPFGSTPRENAQGASTLTKAQAKAALPQYALSKVNAHYLDRLLDNESNDFLVLFEDEAPARASIADDPVEGLALQQQAFQRTRQRILSEFNTNDMEYLHEYTALPSALVRTKNRAALVKLLSHGAVKIVVEDIQGHPTTAQSLPLIHQPEAKAAGRGGAGTTVAVIDSGTDYRHAAFGSCTSPGVPSECRVVAAVGIAADGYTLTNDSYTRGHGTNVAGVVAGVAPDAKIAALDVFNGGGASLSDISKAIDWTIANQSKYNIVAMNLSVGFEGLGKQTVSCSSGTFGAYMTDAFTRARNAKIVPVVAAGNNGFSDGVLFPACVPGAVAVGAVYDANVGGVGWYTNQARTTSCSDATTSADKVTCFSNGGDLVSLLAPGALITAGGIVSGGTSQAAPHVAGAVAVLRATNAAPNDSLTQTEARLKSAGKTVTDWRNGKTKPRLDVYRSLNGLM